jgi:hypothetical protein
MEVLISIDTFIFIYFISLLWMMLGAAVGWALFKRIAAIFVFMAGFGIIGFIIFPGILSGF